MPTFEFKCRHGHAQELLLKSPVKRVACLKCKEWAERVFTMPTVRFRGPGFTKTSA